MNHGAEGARRFGLTISEANAVFFLVIVSMGAETDGPRLFEQYAATWRELAREMNAPQSTHEIITC